MNIIERIADAITGSKTWTGSSPMFIYLGEDEMKELKCWAVKHQYINNEAAKITGEHRPKVAGCKVYVVNAKTHLRVS